MSRPLPPQAAAAGLSDVTDPEVFAAQFRGAYQRMVLVAAGITGDRDGAEDVVQEAAIIAYGKADQFTAGTNFAAWLAEIVRRCALNARRKVRHRRTYATDPASLTQFNGAVPIEASDPRLASGELPGDQTAFDDRVVSALKELSPDARCCLLLRVVEQLSYAEIAETMQIPEGTAMSHVHRSKQALRTRLSASSGSSSPQDSK
jgi:RNA polymerase sigma-70 factor (ECF subfamily)